MDKENLEKLYRELKKEFIHEVLGIMDDNASNYITEAGKAFLDGLASIGELPKLKIEKECEELKSQYIGSVKDRADLKEQVKTLKRQIKKLDNRDILKRKKIRKYFFW